MSDAGSRQRIIVFDVNETLLDIEHLSPLFARLFSDTGVMRQWFAELILYSQALTLSNEYIPFGELGAAVLKMLAAIRQVELQAADLDEFKLRMSQLPAHADAAPALRMLHEAGFRMATLTNSPAEAGKALLKQSGLDGYFERQFSVESVRRYKPATETYRSVESALNASAGMLRMVATHTWDTLGAVAAGWTAALLTRAGNAALAVGPQADIVEHDLLAIARSIIAVDG